LRQSKNHTLGCENRYHMVLIHNSLLSVRNCDSNWFGRLSLRPAGFLEIAGKTVRICPCETRSAG
jgi:hypothetical protein